MYEHTLVTHCDSGAWVLLGAEQLWEARQLLTEVPTSLSRCWKQRR